MSVDLEGDWQGIVAGADAAMSDTAAAEEGGEEGGGGKRQSLPASPAPQMI